MPANTKLVFGAVGDSSDSRSVPERYRCRALVIAERLDRLERHPGLAQPGEAGVPQLVAGRMRQPGPGPGAGDNLIEPGRGQRPTPVGSFEDHEDVVVDRLGRPLAA